MTMVGLRTSAYIVASEELNRHSEPPLGPSVHVAGFLQLMAFPSPHFDRLVAARDLYTTANNHEN